MKNYKKITLLVLVLLLAGKSQAQNKKLDADWLISLFRKPKPIEVKVKPVDSVIRETSVEKNHSIQQTELSKTENYELSMRSMDEYETQFSGMRLNFVNPRVEGFLQSRMKLTHYGELEMKGDSIKYLSQSFQKQISTSKIDPIITFTYEVKPEGEEFMIRSCKVTGNADLVTSFYISFWKTKLNFDDAKGKEIVINYFWEDRIALTIDSKKHIATIEIQKTHTPQVQKKNTSQVQQQRAEPTTSDERKYITGARGGCYYLSNSGKKIYVDRSYCNQK